MAPGGGFGMGSPPRPGRARATTGHIFNISFMKTCMLNSEKKNGPRDGEGGRRQRPDKTVTPLISSWKEGILRERTYEHSIAGKESQTRHKLRT